ncbi:hypothetical protein [uncultured Roseibium sp.]|uniref:hypothetical protein n=1 Tax=uncultured Roseibium sp. TaxID=1936171 RepID=UPI0032168CF0
MNEMMISRLLLCLVSALLLLTTAAAKDVNSLDGAEFRQKFSDNRHLQPADLDIFPTGLRSYLTGGLNWNNAGMSGFSRRIAQRTYLVSVSTDYLGFNSKAALIFAGPSSKISSSSHVTWERLYLPYFKMKTTGWVPYATDEHANLLWNEDLNAIQSSICSDVGTGSCLRYTHKIEGSERRLLKMEILGSSYQQWNILWKDGKWFTGDSTTPNRR